MSKVFATMVLAVTASVAMGYTGAVITAVDVAPSDVPGPQPIRVFPPPAAANMVGAQLIYDNYAEGLGFSADDNTFDDRNFLTFPLTNAAVTINGVTYQGKWSPGGFKVTGVFNAYGPQQGLFTNMEQVPADNRFPAYIPRPGRCAAYDYTAVQFVLTNPAKEFGVYVAMNSNQWQSAWGQNDDNNRRMISGRKLWVAVLGETDTFATAQYLEVATPDMYAPFIHVVGNGTDKIKSVCVVQDSSVEADAPFGFFDVYVVPARKVGDINGDGKVNVFDLQILAASWNKQQGQTGYNPACDLNGDNKVNVFDLQLMAQNWNK